MNPNSNNNSNEWVLDAIVGFLRGPVWNIPLLAFIERESVVFGDDEETGSIHENDKRKLFAQYSSLVDSLLNSQMEELGINEEQFVNAVEEAKNQNFLSKKLMNQLFEQIWAANNYEIFINLMKRKNIEMQLEAIELLAAKYGIIYEMFIPFGQDKDSILDEKYRVDEAIKASLLDEGEEDEEDEDDEEKKVIDEDQKKSLEKELNQSTKDLIEKLNSMKMIKISNEEVKQEKEEKKVKEQEKQIEEIKKEVKDDNKQDESLKKEESLKKGESLKKEKSPKKEESPKKEKSLKKEEKVLEEKKGKEIDEIELRKRSEYLKSQRDKLMAIKIKERNKQLAKIESDELKEKRPKSARAIKKVTFNTESENDEESNRSLEFRRALAERLKKEVIQ